MESYTLSQFTEGLDANGVEDLVLRLEGLGYEGLWIPELTGREPFGLAGFLLARTAEAIDWSTPFARGGSSSREEANSGARRRRCLGDLPQPSQPQGGDRARPIWKPRARVGDARGVGAGQRLAVGRRYDAPTRMSAQSAAALRARWPSSRRLALLMGCSVTTKR